MELETTHLSGAQEWFCPECGRRFVMHFQSEYKRLNILVLESGNEFISHVGGTGGLHINSTEVRTVDDEVILSDELLSALEEALEDIDFEDW
jgi:hypothetical protein